MNGLFRTLLSLNKMYEAVQLFARVNELAERTLEEKDYNRAIFKVQFGHCLNLQEKFSQAEEYLLPSHDVLQESLGKEHPYTQEALNYLIDLYKVWDKPEQIERFDKEVRKAQCSN
jgi:hypothetical protein